MILKIHKTLSRLTEGHSLVSFSRWDSMWPSGTGATNILSIRLYKSLQDPYINTRMLYKAAQVCDVEGYCEKTSLNRERTQSISFRSTKVQRAKDKHWSTQCIYMKTWLSDNSLPNHLENLRGISTGRSFKDKHKSNVSLRQIRSLVSLENAQEKADDLALVAGQQVLRIRSFKKYAKKKSLVILVIRWIERGAGGWQKQDLCAELNKRLATIYFYLQ